MDCPDGHGPLRGERIDDVEADVCPVCFGVWLDNGEIQRVLAGGGEQVDEKTREQLKQLKRDKPKIDWTAKRPCPQCNAAMRQVNYGYSSNVIIDRCEEHGVWLDGGELDLLTAFAQGGRKIKEMAGEAYAEMAASKARMINFVHGANETRYNGLRLTRGSGRMKSLAWIAGYLLGER